MERPLSVLCSRAAQVFLPRAKGKQKTNYKDGHHVTLPTWLRIYIYTHIYTESCTDYGRKFLAGPSPQQASLFSSIYKTFLSRISRAAFRFFLQSYYIINCFSLRVYLERGTEKGKRNAMVPSFCLASKQENSLSVVSQYWDRGEATADGSMNDKLVTRSKAALLFQSFSQFFRLSNNHPIIYIFLLVLSLLNLFSLLLLLNSNGKYGRQEIFPSLLPLVPAIRDKLYSQKYNFLFRLRVLADSSLVARHFRERRIRRFPCPLRGQQLPPLFHATFRCYRYFNVRRQSKYPRLFPPRVIINT